MEIFSILSRVNAYALIAKIEIFRENHPSGYRPYVFINKETSEELLQFESERNLLSVFNTDSELKNFNGYRVFIDDTLAFGEVELR